MQHIILRFVSLLWFNIKKRVSDRKPFYPLKGRSVGGSVRRASVRKSAPKRDSVFFYLSLRNKNFPLHNPFKLKNRIVFVYYIYPQSLFLATPCYSWTVLTPPSLPLLLIPIFSFLIAMSLWINDDILLIKPIARKYEQHSLENFFAGFGKGHDWMNKELKLQY